MSVINVTSEIGKLKKVLLHRPGNELLNLTPDTLEELLFDDIPFLAHAQKEHDGFADVLKANGVEVLYLEDLAAEAIAQSAEIREKFLHQYIAESGVYSQFHKEALFDLLNGIKDAKKLILKTMEGCRLNEIASASAKKTLSDFVLDETGLLVNPMPNLYFTRDPFACIGNGVTVHKMFSETRRRETIYGEYIFAYHPEYAGKVETFYSRYNAYNIEGGDILNISKEVVAVGLSQRTSANAIEVFAKDILFNENSAVKTILVFKIPATRAFMHLDTVFTQIDYDKFTVHPGILGPLEVFEITRCRKTDELHIEAVKAELAAILTKYVGKEVTLIKCAGGDRIASEREQWNDGSNTLCIKPGTVIVYDRNDVTNALLKETGITVLEITSGELSRGRGGPRCMSMPFVREDI